MRRKRKGWVLWEVLLGVILLLVLLGGMTRWFILPMIEEAKRAEAASKCAAYASAVAEYNVELGSNTGNTYPATLEALETAVGQYGPWVREIVEDPWGNDYQYATSASNFAVWSMGPDGVSNSSINEIGGDDIGFIGR